MNTIEKFKQKMQLLKFKIEAVGTKARIEGPISATVKKDITDAINNRYQMIIFYKGDKDLIGGYYNIIPMVWGLNRYTKNNILRAFVTVGGTFNGWVTFRLDRIKSTLPMTDKVFKKAPSGYNPSGDGLMSEELLKVQFPK